MNTIDAIIEIYSSPQPDQSQQVVGRFRRLNRPAIWSTKKQRIYWIWLSSDPLFLKPTEPWPTFSPVRSWAPPQGPRLRNARIFRSTVTLSVSTPWLLINKNLIITVRVTTQVTLICKYKFIWNCYKFLSNGHKFTYMWCNKLKIPNVNNLFTGIVSFHSVLSPQWSLVKVHIFRSFR